MPAPRHTPDVLREALRLVEEHGTISNAARAINVPYPTLRSRVMAARSAQIAGELREHSAEDLIEHGKTFEDEWAVWMKAIGCAKDRYAGPATARAKSGRQRILVIPDVHAPFHDAEKVAAMLERERDIDLAVVMGDIGDQFAISRFVKPVNVPYVRELAAVTALIQTFSERFPAVKMIEGNHDNRVEKRIAERCDADVLDAIRLMTGGRIEGDAIVGGHLSPIRAIANRFPNVEFADHHVEGHSMRWFTTVGDAIFLHAEKYSRVPGSAVRAIDDWLTDFEDTLDLPPWNLMIQAHTHALSWTPWRGHKLLVECGCLALTQGYMLTPRMGGRPQRRGYVVFDQYDGKTDLNSVRKVWLDVERAA